MIGTCRLLGTFLHPPPPLLSHPHHVDTYVDTDKQTTTRTKTGHGRCPIWFEYGAGAAGYLSLYSFTLSTIIIPYLFWHAGECTILFFYILICLHCGRASAGVYLYRAPAAQRFPPMHVHSTVYNLHASSVALFNLSISLSVTDTASSTSADPPACLPAPTTDSRLSTHSLCRCCLCHYCLSLCLQHPASSLLRP